jgi:hypothetical protein
MIFCIGNGESREAIDLHFLKKRGIIYGCNALYRDFAPDKLVVADPDMFKEVIESGYSKSNVVYLVERNAKVNTPSDHKIFMVPWKDNIYPLNSGWAMIRLAYHFRPDEQIYMIGFDIFGERKTIYDDTHNYPQSTESNLNQHEKAGEFFLLKDHFCPKIRLTRVIDDDTKIENIDNITTKQFLEEITWQ